MGRVHGHPFGGLDEKLADSVQQPGEASSGHDFMALDGVLEPRAGTTWSTGVTRPTGKYCVMDGVNGLRFPWIEAYDFQLRWTILLAFRTPSSFSANHYLFGKLVTVGGSDYVYPGIYVDSTGKVTVKLSSAAGADKSFHSGTNLLSADTNYVLQVVRFDTDAYLWWGTESAAPAIKGSTDALGKTNYPVDTATHPLFLGAYWNGAAWSSPGAFELHELTILSKVVEHQDLGYSRYAAPRDEDVVLHCRFEESSSHMLDLSRNGNDSDTETGVATYGATTHSFLEETSVVQCVREFTSQAKLQRVLLVADGDIRAANYHV